MVSNRMTEGVGKKIVEALKQQSDIEIKNVVENPAPIEQDDVYETSVENTENVDNFGNEYEPVQDFNSGMMTFSNIQPESDIFSNDIEGFEIPTNVMVLKQLINQLPAGVSKQTGAQIIKQTMEALGISMKSVLQEAQQVQENLNISSKQCQATIMEHRKQIGVLERQAQKYQKQSQAINDIISLFVQTNI